MVDGYQCVHSINAYALPAPTVEKGGEFVSRRISGHPNFATCNHKNHTLFLEYEEAY